MYFDGGKEQVKSQLVDKLWSNSAEEITGLDFSSLDPPFPIFVQLCSCDFQAVESFTA